MKLFKNKNYSAEETESKKTAADSAPAKPAEAEDEEEWIDGKEFLARLKKKSEKKSGHSSDNPDADAISADGAEDDTDGAEECTEEYSESPEADADDSLGNREESLPQESDEEALKKEKAKKIGFAAAAATVGTIALGAVTFAAFKLFKRR